MRLLVMVLVLGLIAFHCDVASGQTGCSTGGISLFIDPSVRSAGMGSATTAFFRGHDPNYWANPALLGYHRGVRYESSDTQLVPDLADDVFFTTDRWTVGAWGVGFAINSWPGNQAGTFLDYGESLATDEFGNIIGSFHSFEEVESWGVGVNLLEAYENLVGPRAGSWSRYGDVSLGYSRKHVFLDLAPSVVLGGGEAVEGAGDTDDIGILVRATPYNTIDHPSDTTPVGLRFDAGWGRAIQNHNDEEIFYETGQTDPILRETRWGLFAAGAVGFPDGMAQSLRESSPSWLIDWLVGSVSPLAEVGVSWDFSTVAYPDGGGHTDCREIQTWGVELTLLQIFTLRRGSIDDDGGQVHGSTTGWGLGFQLSDLGGFRIDRATVPQAEGLVDVDREGFMAWVNLLAMAREFRRL